MLNNLTAYFRIRPIPLVYIVKSIAWEFFAFVFHTVLHLVFVSIVFTYLIFLTFKYSFYVNSRQKTEYDEKCSCSSICANNLRASG